MSSAREVEAAANRAYIVVGTLLSVAAGLLLALVAFGVVLVLAGSPTEGWYCSDNGRGRYEATPPGRQVIYIDAGWNGVPPALRCKVYLAGAYRDNPPRRLVAESTYPGTREYAWVVGAFLLPLVLWCVLLAATDPRNLRRPVP